MATTRRQHPSVRFQNNEVRDFNTAMEVYVAQYQEEMRITREIIREYPDERPGHDAKVIEEQSKGLAHVESMVQKARAIYAETVAEAIKQAARKMHAEGDYNLRMIADALESGDWSQLAL
jgi:hypothetical protein